MSERRPLVVKVGGGLLREEGLEGLRRACMEVNEMAARRPVLVVPGGGPFADTVRAVDAQVGLGDGAAHELALRAMDQLGVLLAGLLPGFELLTDLIAPRSIGLLVAASAFAGRPEIPESWAVTSDSLAVLAAAAIGAEEAILFKSVAGILPWWPSEEPPLPALTAEELKQLQAAGGGKAVDRYLPEAVCLTGVSVAVRRPSPSPSCTSRHASGTRITRG